MITMILSILAIVLAVVAIGYSAHCAITFQRFNDGIKDWANALDVSTKEAIDRSARQILREMDERISEANEDENVEPLNIEENGKEC